MERGSTHSASTSVHKWSVEWEGRTANGLYGFQALLKGTTQNQAQPRRRTCLLQSSSLHQSSEYPVSFFLSLSLSFSLFVSVVCRVSCF